MILYVLSFIYKILLNNKTCTKRYANLRQRFDCFFNVLVDHLFREIYYSDPEFTQSQVEVDHAVMDICYILNARPWEMGVFSSSKGLIAGSIKLTLNDDTILDVGNIEGGRLRFSKSENTLVYSISCYKGWRWR